MKVKTVIPLALTLLGGIWVYYGLAHHGFWDPVKGPLPGFVPSLLAVLLCGVGVLGIVRSLREEGVRFAPENWAILLAALAAFALVFLIGMLPALLAFVFVWLKIYEKESWKNTLVVCAISFAIAYGVFVLWLAVPFPNGILIDAVLYG
jgi:hypothetical protein